MVDMMDGLVMQLNEKRKSRGEKDNRSLCETVVILQSVLCFSVLPSQCLAIHQHLHCLEVFHQTHTTDLLLVI